VNRIDPNVLFDEVRHMDDRLVAQMKAYPRAADAELDASSYSVPRESRNQKAFAMQL
jgi:hypothetical protein